MGGAGSERLDLGGCGEDDARRLEGPLLPGDPTRSRSRALLPLEEERVGRCRGNPARLRSHFAKLALFQPTSNFPTSRRPWERKRLRECWDYFWGERSSRTRAKVRSVWIDFFEWAVRERDLHGNPARPLAAPKKRDVPTETFPPSVVERVISSQEYPADIIGATLVLRYGLRRGGIVSAQRRHFDFERQLLTVHTKGGGHLPAAAARRGALARARTAWPRGAVEARRLAPLSARHAPDASRSRGSGRNPHHRGEASWVCERDAALA